MASFTDPVTGKVYPLTSGGMAYDEHGYLVDSTGGHHLPDGSVVDGNGKVLQGPDRVNPDGTRTPQSRLNPDGSVMTADQARAASNQANGALGGGGVLGVPLPSVETVGQDVGGYLVHKALGAGGEVATGVNDFRHGDVKGGIENIGSAGVLAGTGGAIDPIQIHSTINDIRGGNYVGAATSAPGGAGGGSPLGPIATDVGAPIANPIIDKGAQNLGIPTPTNLNLGGGGGTNLAGTGAGKALADYAAQMEGVAAAARTPQAPPQIDSSVVPTGPAAQVAPVGGVQAQQISTPGGISGGTLTAQQFGAPTGVAAQQIGAPTGVTAERIGAPTPIAAPQTVTAGSVAAQQIGAPTGVTASNVAAERVAADPDARAAQLRGLSALEAAARGEAPSAAESLLRKATDSNAANAFGMAASLQGRNSGLALRAGQRGMLEANAKSAADLAATRAQEQATARGQFQEAASAMGAQGIDVGKANQAAGLTAATANQSANLQANITTMSAQLDTLKSNAANALAAGQTNVASSLQAQVATLQGQIDVAKANLAASTDVAKTNAANALTANVATMGANVDVAKSNQAAALQAGIANMSAQLDTLKSNQAAALQAGQATLAADMQAKIATLQGQIDVAKANAANTLAADTSTMNAQLAAAMKDAELSGDWSKFKATQDLAVAQSNQAAGLQQQQITDTYGLGMTNATIQALMNAYTPESDTAKYAALEKAGQLAFYGQLVGAGGTALAASDETVKTDIVRNDVDAADAFLSTLKPATYEYRGGYEHGYPGRKLGIIAQDLAPASVTRGPDGKKWISADVIGEVLAGMGRLRERVERVERVEGK